MSELHTIDGHAGEISYRVWPNPDATHVVILAHGYGEHIGRYEHVAAAFGARGALVAGPDHVGHGRSVGERVLMTDYEGVIDDLHAVVTRVRTDHTELPPETLSRDPSVGEAYVADELVWHGPFKRTTLESLATALSTVNEASPLRDLPTLWIHGEADQLVPIEQTREGIGRLGATNLREVVYSDARHEVFNELNADEVLATTADFIDEVAPAA